MPHRLLVPEILELLSEGRHADLVQIIDDLHPKDAAAHLCGLEADQIAEILSIVPLEIERDLFIYLDPEVQEDILRGQGRERVKALLAAMASDERAELMEEVDERVRDYVYPLLTRADRIDLLRREEFEDDQVGAILSTEYCVLDASMTAVQAIDAVRRQAPSRETIYYSYVVDAQGKLVGLVSLRDLIMARSHETIESIMRANVQSVTVESDQEEAADLIREYDLLAIPVTDKDGKLMGIVTHDDAAEIAEEEAAEDIENLAGIIGEAEQEDYIKEPVFSHFRRRILWVVILAVTFVGIAAIIKGFEVRFANLPIQTLLFALLPMVLATGGNVGAQASTAVILGLRHALQPNAFWTVLWKELRVSVCMAIVLGMVAGGVAYFMNTTHPEIILQFCGAITLAMAVHVITAALFGAAIPLIVAALGRDPSMVATPALTTVADLSGTVIYFLIVTSLL